jgi:hypothetical protein
VEQGEEVPRVFGQLLHAEARPVREPQVEDHADEVVVEGVVARLRAEAMVREHGEGQQHRTIPIGNPGLSNTHSRLSILLIPWLTSLKQFNTTIKCKHIPSKRLLLPYSVTPNDTKAKKVKLRICVITGCKKHTPGAWFSFCNSCYREPQKNSAVLDAVPATVSDNNVQKRKEKLKQKYAQLKRKASDMTSEALLSEFEKIVTEADEGDVSSTEKKNKKRRKKGKMPKTEAIDRSSFYCSYRNKI